MFKTDEILALVDRKAHDYIRSLIGNLNPQEVSAPHTIHAEMIDWTDDPHRWAEPWSGRYAFIVVQNHEQRDLPGREEYVLKMKRYFDTSTYRLPQSHRPASKTVHFQGSLCSCTTLTNNEVKDLESKLPEAIIIEWRQASAAAYETFVTNELAAVPLFEQPFTVSIRGNDDTSYGKAFGTSAEALDVVDSLRANPTWDNLERIGFVFTN